MFGILLVGVQLAVMANVGRDTRFTGVLNADLFRFCLRLPIAEVRVIRLLLATLTVISLYLNVRVLVSVRSFSCSARVGSRIMRAYVRMFLAVTLDGVVARDLYLSRPRTSGVRVVAR